MTGNLKELRQMLPPVGLCREGDDQDLRARAALSLLLDAPRSAVPSTLTDPWKCPNCGGACENARTPYCSERCKEEAAFVRQFRASFGNGNLADPERQAALGQKLWQVLGGGLPRRIALIPQRVWTRVLERDVVCQICGAPAVLVDHAGSG
ncbi:MAG: hypothetical protein JSS66_18000 [Armatimonadetes bacterium]|nr:hypothetical protein [Armatimonadota bacterium]